VKKLSSYLVCVLAFGLVSCSTTKCKSIDSQGKIREACDEKSESSSAQPTQPAAQNQLAPVVSNAGMKAPEAAVATPPAAATPASAAAPTSAPETVKVYKYDNSRQCGQGEAVPLEDMAKQLKNIKILGQEKKNDGMMRIQMCGAPTGIANVYEINKKDLKRAAKLGFREWKYTQ